MNPDKIRFNCPACGIQLDVPASLAGVTGPCPSCRAPITAPHPQQAPPQQTPPQQAPPQQAPPQQAPPQQTASNIDTYEETVPDQSDFPSLAPEQPDPQISRPQVHATPDEPAFPLEHEQPVRALRTIEDVAREQEETEGLKRPTHPDSGPSPSKQASRLPSILFLLVAIILMTLAVLTVLSLTGVVGLNSLKSLLGIDKPTKTETVTPPTEPKAQDLERPLSIPGSSPEPITQDNPLIIDPENPSRSIIPVVPVTPSDPKSPPRLPDGEDFREGETPLPSDLGLDRNSRRKAQEILENFLTAKNLASRTNFLSTESLANPELKSSILARDLPKPLSIVSTDILYDDKEERIDYFYVVSWGDTEGTPKKPISVELHKWPGREPPHMQSEAFTELYEQKLADYAITPRDLPARFFVIAQCLPQCFEHDLVSNHQSKATLKLGSFPKDRDIIKAYFDKNGDTMEQLKGYRGGIALSEAIPMTITLAWTPEEKGSKRYLEIIKINSFDWHP